MDITDVQLAADSRNGSRQAFGELVRRHQDAVFNLVWRMSGNWHEAGDLTQETFLRAYRNLHRYRPEFAFKTWLLSIGANLTRNWFRSFARQRQREAVLAAEAEEPAPVMERDEALDRALARLPSTLRRALLLKHLEVFSYDEVARALGIGVSAAKMRVARGRDELVRLLAMEESP